MSLEDLATAVIGRAVQDAEAGRPDLRDSARHFLAGSSMFRFWCNAAGARPETVQRALARRRGPHR